jgi:hypothetical protein
LKRLTSGSDQLIAVNQVWSIKIKQMQNPTFYCCAEQPDEFVMKGTHSVAQHVFATMNTQISPC